MNTQTAPTTALATVIAPALPERGEQIVTNKGNVVGQAYWFAAESASELRERFKLAGKKGADLKDSVLACLKSETDSRTLLGIAFGYYMAQNGFVPDVAKVRKNTATLHYVKIGADSKEAAKAAQDEIAALKAEIAKLKGTPAPKTIEAAK